jgi:Cu(I)-responsive transcriptional regulator
MAHMNIGEAAAAAGVTPKMIRHYESLGMIPDVQRTESGYRLYSPKEVAMLRFIRQARALGFPAKQVDSLLALWRDDHRASREVKELAQEQLRQLEAHQREIDEMRATLAHLVSLCRGDDNPHCAILEQLSASHSEPEKTEAAARRNLKQVRAGTKAPARQQHCHDTGAASPPAQPHEGLVAWTRSLGR